MTVAAQVKALVAHRMRRGVSKTHARLQLAVALGASELSVRKWERGTQPIARLAAAIRRLYDEEVQNG